jgi:outer membrane receptor protein involved in Fe transport
MEYRVSSDQAVYTNYTYESITDHAGVPGNLHGTPLHKWNLGGRTALGHGFQFSANLGYKDAYTAVQSAALSIPSGFIGQDTQVPAYWRLDAKLAYSPSDAVEFFVACQNIADAEHIESIDGETIPRTYEGGVSVKFGK